MSRLDPHPTSLRLRAGEQHVLRVAAGTRCVAARGKVRIVEPPRWLAERLVQASVALDEGGEHEIERGGWITLHAAVDCLLICRAPARRLAPWRIIRPVRPRRAVA